MENFNQKIVIRFLFVFRCDFFMIKVPGKVECPCISNISEKILYLVLKWKSENGLLWTKRK